MFSLLNDILVLTRILVSTRDGFFLLFVTFPVSILTDAMCIKLHDVFRVSKAANVVGLAVGDRSAACRPSAVGQHGRTGDGCLVADADHSERRDGKHAAQRAVVAAATAAAAATTTTTTTATTTAVRLGVRELAVLARCAHVDVPDAAAAGVQRVGVERGADAGGCRSWRRRRGAAAGARRARLILDRCRYR